MNDWIVDVLIKPDIKQSDLDRIAKRIAKAVSSQTSVDLKINDKDLEKAAGDVVKSVNSVLRELSTNLSSFVKIIKQAQVEAGKATAATTRSVQTHPAFQAPGVSPGRPVRSSAKQTSMSFGEDVSYSAATKSRTESLKRDLERKANKGAKELSNVLNILLDAPEDAAKIIRSEAAKIKSESASKTRNAMKGLSDNFNNIITVLQAIGSTDTAPLLQNISKLRPLLKNLATRFKAETTGFTLPGKEDIESAFSPSKYRYAAEPGSNFGKLKAALGALKGVAKRPGEAPEESVVSTLSEIGKLIGEGPGSIKGGKQEKRQLRTKVERLVQDMLKKLVVGLEGQIVEIGKQLDQAMTTGAKPEEITRLAGNYNNAMAKMYNTLLAVDRASKGFNINLEETAKGRKATPGGYKPEAAFLATESYARGLRKELELDQAALQAVKIAQSFKEIPDPVIRTKAIFRELWANARAGSGDLTKTIARVSEYLKGTSVSGLVNRKEVEDLISLLDRYRKQIQDFRLQQAGLGGGRAAHPVIPRILDKVEEGGVNKEFLRAVARARATVANDPNIKQGVKIPITIPVETAAGIRNVSIELRKMSSSFDRVIPKVRELRNSLSFRESLTTAFRRVALWGTAAGITYGAVNAFRQAGRTMTEVETGVTNLSKVVVSADKDLEAFSRLAVESAKRIATEFGTSMQEAFKSMRIFAQQGLEMADVIQLTEATALAANTTVLDQTKAAEGLTSAIKQFGLETSSSMAIVDAWNEVAKRNAVTELTLVDALKKAGSAARTVGVDFNQLIGLTTAVGEATRQPGKEVGTSLRFIFQRTLRPETARVLSKMGVATKDLEGNFRGFMEILTDLSGKWESYNKSQQLAVAQALGGARQYNAAIALMNNYSTAVKASEDSINSQGSAQLENIKVMDTTTKIFAQTKASIDAMSVSMGSVFLPVVQKVAQIMKSVLDVFAAMPPSIHLITGGLALATVGFTRFAHQADMLMMGGFGGTAGGATAGVGAGLLGGVVGKGRRGIDPQSQEGARLGEFGIAAAALGDYSGGAIRNLSSLEGKIVDINGKAVQGSERFSKMGLAIRKMGYVSSETGEAVRVGFSHMNSPISQLILLLGLAGKGVLSFGVHIANWATNVVGVFKGVSDAAIKQAAAARLATVANMGWMGSLAGLAIGGAVIAGVYYLGKHLYKLATAQRKSGEQTQKDLRAELAQRQEVLRDLQRQRSLLKSLDTQKQSISRSEKATSSEGMGGIKADIADFKRYNFEMKKVKSVSEVAQIGPEYVEGFDRFGNAILKAANSFEHMGRAAVEAQAHLVALTRLKIAKAFAKDVIEATEKLNNLEKSLKKTYTLASIERFGFGGASEETITAYKKEASKAYTQNVKVDRLVSNIISQMKALPKDVSLFSLEKFAKSKEIMDALYISIRKNNSALEAAGKPAATAVDKINQLALSIKGFKGVGLKVFETKGLYDKQGAVITSLEDIIAAYEKTKKRLRGNELVLIEGDNPFGLTQANTAINMAGELIVEGFDKNGNRIQVAFSEFVRKMRDTGKVSIIDPTVLNKKISKSILEVQRKLSGAGAGLLDIPGKLDLGVNFDFQLGDVDRLQKVGNAAAESIKAAYQAQKEYNSTLEDFKKQYKTDPTAALSAERARALNISRAIVSASMHVLKFESVLEGLGNTFAKTAHELNKAAISDRVEAQVGAVYGTISGYSEKLTVKLPKTLEELSPDERLARSNPELVMGIRASQRTMEKLKSQIVSMEQLSGGDIQKMFESFTNQDQKIFTSAMDALGGDLKGATMVTHLGNLERINKQGFSNIYKALTGQPDKKDAKKIKDDQIKAAGSTVDSLSESFSKYVTTSRALETGSYRKRSDTGLVWENRAAARFNRKEEERLKEVRAQALSVFGVRGAAKERPAGPGSVVEAYNEQMKKLPKTTEKGFKAIMKEEAKNFLSGGAAGLNEKESLALLASRLSISTRQKAISVGTVGGRYDPQRGPLTEDLKLVKVSKDLESLSDKFAKIAAGELDTKELKELYSVLKAYRQMMLKQATSPTAGIGTPAGAASGSSLATAFSTRRAVFDKALRTLGLTLDITKYSAEKLLKTFLGLSEALGFVGKRVQSFIFDVSKGIENIRITRDLGRLTRGLSAPIAGELKGVSVEQIGLGKFKDELSAVERVAKQFSSYFTNIAEQEKSRTGAISLFSSASSQLLKVRKDVAGLLTGGEKLANREALVKLQSRAELLYRNMSFELGKVNDKMSPFIESLSKMIRLEAAKKSIEDIVTALKKAEQLEFDTTSIDKVFGQHPLAPVRPQYGEPVGLDKFQQQMFQLEQKRRAGTISGEDFSYERKKIGWQKEEALIQYQQTKENAKLRSEVEGARRAMGILWDAQSQGIGGLNGLIQTLKTELESAGEATRGRSGVMEYQGVPSLVNVSKELSKVQAAVKEKDFRQQRDIVMAPLEGLQAEANKLLEQVKDEISNQTKAISIVSGGTKDKDLAGNVQNMYKSSGEFVTKVLHNSVNSIGEALVRMGSYINSGTDEHIPKLLKGINVVTDAFGALSSNTIMAANKIAGVSTMLQSGTKIPGAAAGSPTATPVTKASGGFITGPGGVDNVPAMLTSGEYVIPKKVVDKYGAGFFDSIRNGSPTGFWVGGLAGFSRYAGYAGSNTNDNTDVLSAASLILSGKNYAGLSKYGDIGHKLKDFIDGIKAGLRGPGIDKMTLTYLDRALKDAGLGKFAGLSGFTSALFTLLTGKMSIKGGYIALSSNRRKSSESGDEFSIPGGTITLSGKNTGRNNFNYGNKFSIPGGSITLRGTSSDYGYPGGYSLFGRGERIPDEKALPGGSFAVLDSSGKILKSTPDRPLEGGAFAIVNSAGELIKSLSTAAETIKGGSSALVDSEGNLLKDLEKRFGVGDFSAFGPSPGQLNARNVYASGGIISGPGGIDNVPAMLTSGEYVIPKKVVDRYGVGYFNSLISGSVRGFADGGEVGGSLGAGLDVLAANALNNLKDQLIELGKVKVSRLPLALSSAGDPEKMPDYVAADYARAARKKMSPDEADFVAAYSKSLPSSTSGAGVEAPVKEFANVITVVKDKIVTFGDVITNVKDRFNMVGEATTKVKDFALHLKEGAGQSAGGKLEFLGGQVGTVPEVASRVAQLETSVINLYKAGTSKNLSIEQAPAITRKLEQEKAAAAEIFRRDPRLGGLPLPASFQSEEQRRAGGAILTTSQEAGLPVEYQTLIGALHETSKTLAGLSTGVSEALSKPPSKKVDSGIGAAGGFNEKWLDKLADGVYTSVMEALKDAEIVISKDSITEIEASIKRGAEALTNVLSQAAPTLQGGKGGSLGAAIRPEIEQLNGRVDALSEKIILENDALQSKLNERFSDVETQMMAEIKKIYDSKFAQTDSKTESVLAQVRQVESLLHSVNSRVGDK